MDAGSDFNFQYLPNYEFSSLENSQVKECFTKWSMLDGLITQAYSFDKPFRKYNERDFVLDFFGCPNVAATLKNATKGHKFASIDIPAETVKFSEVKCTLTTLQLFEKLKTGNKIVRSNGSIVKCMPLYVSGGGIHQASHTFELEVADNLRKLVLADIAEIDDELLDDIELATVFTGAERKEFLFALFSHLVIGGSLCQYEETVEPYIEVTKKLYKDLIAVARVENNDEQHCDKLSVISHVYKIHSLDNKCAAPGTKNLLFHREYLNNFFYIIVNPLKQLCFTIYHHV